MKFNYQARTQTGEIKSGVVEASNREAALDTLKAYGLFVTAIAEATTPVFATRLTIFERVSSKDVVVFARQMAIMFKSRVPLTETFETIAKQTANRAFQEKIFQIAKEVEGGATISAALSLYPNIFSNFFVGMVKSGEASGKLSDVLAYLADYMEREYKFRSKIKGAMIYPAFIIVVFLAVATLIVTFVIPQLTEILKSSEQQLPLITRIVMWLADFMRKWILLIIIVFILVVMAVWRFYKTSDGKKFFDHFFMGIPFFNSFLKKLYLSRFASNLSTLIGGGIPIVQALEITADVVNNDVYKNVILEVRDGVKKGETVSAVLQRYPSYISPLFYQMVVVGEKTGSLDSCLADVDKGLDNFIKLLEPLLIVLLGGVVGGLIAAVLLPIYSMSSF